MVVAMGEILRAAAAQEIHKHIRDPIAPDILKLLQKDRRKSVELPALGRARRGLFMESV